MPEDVVMGMVESVNMGWWAKWSIPAEKRWISFRLGEMIVSHQVVPDVRYQKSLYRDQIRQ